MDLKDEMYLKINACKIRTSVIEATNIAGSGHPGGSLSATDILTYLYFKELNVDPHNPKDPLRDRFVLSKGHAAPALYSTLALKGFFDCNLLKTLRQLGSNLQGHPNMNLTPGVDMSTGSLGQGASVSCGMAISAKIKNVKFRVYALLGDGEIEEGQIWEAALFASHYNLSNLCWIVDVNGLQIDGNIKDVAGLCDIPEKFKAFGFNVLEADGHNFNDIENAFLSCSGVLDKPNVIVLNTVKGKGVSFMEGNVDWHGKSTNQDEYIKAIDELKKELLSLSS